MLFLINSLFETTLSLLKEHTIANDEFINKFSLNEDKKKLYEAIDRLKNSNYTTAQITLKNNEKVIIFINKF